MSGCCKDETNTETGCCGGAGHASEATGGAGCSSHDA